MLKPTARPSTKRFSRGFTLIEILVVIAIVAIVSVLAGPDLSALIKSNRIAGTVNAVNADITFAKSEAIKRGAAVTLCASSDQASCSASSNLANGWIVFSDPNENQAVDEGEAVIKVQDKLKGNDSVVLSDGQAAISFSHNGFIYNLPSSGMQVINVKSSDSDPRSQRCLTFRQMGQAKIIKGGDRTCT